ncbi:hypothetical protein Efla_007533 [Eimeria flavescens]
MRAESAHTSKLYVARYTPWCHEQVVAHCKTAVAPSLLPLERKTFPDRQKCGATMLQGDALTGRLIVVKQQEIKRQWRVTLVLQQR